METDRASAELQQPRRLDRVEEGPVVRDDHERAVVAVERGLELFDRLEVEVVRRLVEEEEVDLPRLQLGEVRARPLAGRERRPRPPDVIGAETELREQRACVDRREPGDADERLEQRLV